MVQLSVSTINKISSWNTSPPVEYVYVYCDENDLLVFFLFQISKLILLPS